MMDSQERTEEKKIHIFREETVIHELGGQSLVRDLVRPVESSGTGTSKGRGGRGV